MAYEMSYDIGADVCRGNSVGTDACGTGSEWVLLTVRCWFCSRKPFSMPPSAREAKEVIVDCFLSVAETVKENIATICME